jgi:hypothetical protein
LDEGAPAAAKKGANCAFSWAAGPSQVPDTNSPGFDPYLGPFRSLSVDHSLESDPGAQACHAAMTAAALANGQLRENMVTVGAVTVVKVSAVTIPRWPPPPPRQAQNRSAFSVAFAVLVLPSAVTISTEVSESMVSP